MLRELRDAHVDLRRCVRLLDKAYLRADLRRAVALTAKIEQTNIKLEQLRQEGFRVCG